MDSRIVVSPEASNSLALANLTPSWTQSQTAPSNSTYLFIAVEYVKDTNEYKLTSDTDFSNRETPTCSDFQQHVSPLDPNMSSAARYSPSSTPDADIRYNNSVVVPQLITSSGDNRQYLNNLTQPHPSLSHIPPIINSDANVLKQVTNRYLLNQNSTTNISNPGVLQLVPDRNAEQEVELLITDQATGISYNVSAQEYLVERCLADEQQLLEALTPGPLLDTDLLALDESTLKSQLPDIVENVDSQALNTIVNQSLSHLEIKIEEFEDKDLQNQDNLRRSQRQIELKGVEKEDLFLNQVRTISDKPVETRARATLPAPYLAIIKQSNGEYGVFARKVIPKQTQFGPLEGLLIVNNRKSDDAEFQLLVEYETGSTHRLDVSDENVSNWMCFVRAAKTYMEQNLVVFQQGNALYYTSTVNIWPKQELLVGYSSAYAKKHCLSLLQPPTIKENEWPCYECDKQFSSCLSCRSI